MRKQAKERVIVWGAGGHARVVVDILRHNGREVVGFVDDETPGRARPRFCGVPVADSADKFIADGIQSIIIAIGDNLVRNKKAQMATAMGCRLIAAVVHPGAIVASDVRMGVGTVVMAGAVVNPGARIGENVIINTLAGIDHDCVVADGAHISPGVHMAGNVRVERLAWIGIGATVIDNIKIGEGALVGAGAVVIRDVPANTVVAGVPAGLIKRKRRI